MLLLSGAAGMALLDGSACALLAAAAAARARNLGAHFTGAAVLGCLCGIIGPLLREAFQHGQAGSLEIAEQMPAEALVGALGALASLWLARGLHSAIFFWLDAASIGLASCAGTILALQDLGVTGAICLGLINGLAPGLVRDMALGDTAMLVDKEWYASAAAIGCVAAIAAYAWIAAAWLNEWTAARADEAAVLFGACVVLGLRAWKGSTAAD